MKSDQFLSNQDIYFQKGMLEFGVSRINCSLQIYACCLCGFIIKYDEP